MDGPLTNWADTERDQAAAELADLVRQRDRMVEAHDRNPHLNAWKVPQQLAALDRGIARLRALVAA